MDDKALKKRLKSKLAMHMLFGLGGAVVIIGALFKILHLEIGPITWFPNQEWIIFLSS